MAVSSKASATAIFDLKSAALTVLALVLKTPDLDPLATALAERFGATPGLFEHEPLCLDVSALRDSEAALDFPALIALLRSYGFNPMSARGGSVAQMAAALEAGLAEAPDVAPPRNSTAPGLPALPQTSPDAAAPKDADAADPAAGEAGAGPDWSDTVPPDLFAAADLLEAQAAHQDDASPQRPPAAEPLPVTAAAPSVPALVIDKPLRSGQQVYARGTDLIVLAVVSFGAEVIADGNIHIYAPLRGRALAGARGDTSARIFTTSMEAQLVSIAGTWRTTESGVPEGVTGRPAQVRLDGDKLIFEPLKF